MRQLILLLCLFAPLASACPSLVVGSEGHRAIQVQELAVQKRLAGELATRAEAVFVAEVLERQNHSAQLRVLQPLKGRPSGVLQVPTPPTNALGTIGCWPSAMFTNVTLLPGERVVVYLVDGEVARAASVSRGEMDIPLDAELAIAAAGN